MTESSNTSSGARADSERCDWRFSNIVWLGAWCGVLAAALEYARRAYFDRWILNDLIYLDHNAVWLLPAGSAFFFVCVAVVLAVLRCAWPRACSPHTCVLIFFALTLFNLLLTQRTIHHGACLLLSLGMATVAARAVFSKRRSIIGWMSQPLVMLLGLRKGVTYEKPSDLDGSRLGINRRQLMAATTLCIGAPAVGAAAWWKHIKRQELRGLTSSGHGRPNIVLLVLDTVRASSLSLYGYDRVTTPNLERIASRGVCFDWAISGAPWTLTSHACMFTGRYPPDLSCSWTRPLNSKQPTLAESLANLGYATAGFVANTVYCARPLGLARGFHHYEDVYLSAELVGQSSTLLRSLTDMTLYRLATGTHDIIGRADADLINRRFLQWVKAVEHRPFFCFLNYFDAHGPYVPPSPYDSMFGRKRKRTDLPLGKRAKSPNEGYPLTPAELELEQDQYDGSIAYLDHMIGRLVDSLDELGELENTVLVITSDHGEEFAEHSVLGHGNSLYLPSLHVPLMMSYPDRIPSGLRIQEPVSLRDIGATLLHLLNSHDHGSIPGTPLSRHWTASSEANLGSQPKLSFVDMAPRNLDWYPVSRGDMQSVCLGPYHYIKNGDGIEEVYNVAEDALETQDLSDTPEGREVANECRRHLEDYLGQIG